jgi:beta-glucosidase
MAMTNWTLKQKIGQMVVVRASGYLFDRQIRYPIWEAPASKLKHWLQDLNIGGVILLGGSAGEIYLRVQQLQEWAQTPLTIAADVEEGVGQRFTGATWFAPPMALSEIARKNLPQALEYARAMGEITAREALAIGINWLYAPIVDVNNNRDNPVINVRSFGDNPELVSQLTGAFIEGASLYRVLTTAKHFPGHGDTAVDSHLHLPVLPHSESRLEEIELPPFQSAIARGVDSIMTAHLSIPVWDAERPATLSEKILTGQLRQKLGFKGLIVTDALIMGGVAQYASPGEIAVMAVEAGADVLLMPSDPEIAIAAVENAVQSGRLSWERIEESVERIAEAKSKVAFSNQHDIFSLERAMAIKVSEGILRDSMQFGGNLPLKVTSQTNWRNLIVVDDVLNCDFLDRHTPAVTIPKELGCQIQLLDSNNFISYQLDDTPTILQVFLRANPFRGRAGFTTEAREFYENIIARNTLQGLVIYGSPYILDWFKTQLSSRLPWIFTYGQMPAAQSIALEKLFDLSKNHDLNSTDFL